MDRPSVTVPSTLDADRHTAQTRQGAWAGIRAVARAFLISLVVIAACIVAVMVVCYVAGLRLGPN
ncbi:hypothetical protein IMW82_13280 [Rhodanobacter sp. B2A1Ga4]|uniref:hypothetical protein n=1 Tax=Rhodanobacter sp. B2A1Ga4 TaxID=2778647 RepID=UPI001B35DA94|nr:hypothetical protein [Rhodanobacter sp. B2A1Ga4]MBQ4855644.1 hypothetical protein [Rhodanobacter sp. B2A1Ga4]